MPDFSPAYQPIPVQPRCQHHEACGGCLWQHVSYADQLRLKKETLRSLLATSLGTEAPSITITDAGADSPWAYRRKVHFAFSTGDRGRGLVMGHYRRGSQALVPVVECPVHADAGNRVAFAIRDALGDAHIDGVSRDLKRGIARHLVVRVARRTGECLATLVVTRNDKALRQAVRRILSGPEAPDGLHLNVHSRPGAFLFGPVTQHLAGMERVREEIAGLQFLVSPTAFFQTNVEAAERMVRTVLDELSGANSVVDLYAGAGLFSLALAKAGARVTAVEENPQAVGDGEASRRLNRIPESACRFVVGRAEDVAAGRHRRSVAALPDAVVLDPPRDGCAAPVLSWIAHSLQPAKIVYVSCNPEALAADARSLHRQGYPLSVVHLVDMFPHTPHIESIALFHRS